MNTAVAQDLEPRRWTPLPLGTNIVGIAYGHTTGNIDFDPALKIENADVKVDSVIVSYVKPFSLAGKLMRFDALLPWQRARWEGLLDGQPASAERTGLADPILRVSLNLFGAPDDGPAALHDYMTTHPVNTIVGAAVAVSLPLGEYYADKLLNLGQNRYIIRPQIGVVHNRGPWSYELTGSVFFFTDNHDFFNGGTREQEPLYAMQAHVIRVLMPGMWASLSAGYGKGGHSTINGQRKDDESANFLSGLSVGLRVSRYQSIKMAYIVARTQTDTGSDTDSLLVSWSVIY